MSKRLSSKRSELDTALQDEASTAMMLALDSLGFALPTQLHSQAKQMQSEASTLSVEEQRQGFCTEPLTLDALVNRLVDTEFECTQTQLNQEYRQPRKRDEYVLSDMSRAFLLHSHCFCTASEVLSLLTPLYDSESTATSKHRESMDSPLDQAPQLMRQSSFRRRAMSLSYQSTSHIEQEQPARNSVSSSTPAKTLSLTVTIRRLSICRLLHYWLSIYGEDWLSLSSTGADAPAAPALTQPAVHALHTHLQLWLVQCEQTHSQLLSKLASGKLGEARSQPVTPYTVSRSIDSDSRRSSLWAAIQSTSAGAKTRFCRDESPIKQQVDLSCHEQKR